MRLRTTRSKGAAGEARRARDELENAKGRLEAARRDSDELAKARKEIFDLGSERASLRTDLEKTHAAHDDQVRQLVQLRGEVQAQFKLLANEALQANSEDFVKRANELFTLQKDLTAKELDERTKSLEDLIKPLGDSLTAYDIALKAIEKERVEGFAAINTTLQAVNAQSSDVKSVTNNLVNALRAAPKREAVGEKRPFAG